MAKRYQKRRRIGACEYEITLAHTADARVDLTVRGSDRDGEIVAELAGVLPVEHCAEIGTMLWRSGGGLRAYDLEQIRERHPLAYARWRPEDDDRLVRLQASGWDIGRLAAEFGRNTGAIRSRLAKLGVDEISADGVQTI